MLGERPGPAGYLTVTTRRYAMPDEREADWDVLVGGSTVAVVAVTAANEVVLARQFRPGPGKVMLELPVADFVSHVRSGELTDADVAWMCLDRLCPWPPSTGIEGAGLTLSAPDQQ
ncbi:hypothetical protein GCM10009826_00140 [Humibacillus xanthopallidus]